MAEGSDAPQRAALPATLHDDDQPAAKVETFAARLTVAQKYASTELYGRAQQDPVALAALVLPELDRKKIIKVSGAIDYSTEVTCVIVAKVSDRPSLMAL